MEGITMKQADVIGEVANICIGNAATALSLMTNRPTNITTPTVEILTKEESLVQPERILVKVPYTKGLNGTNLMILKEQDALIIANLMMGGSGDTTGMAFDDITVSAVSEAMNQMCGRIATSLSEILHRPTDIGFPLINSKYKTTFEIPDELCDGTDIVKVTFRLTVEGLINSTIWQLYPLSIVKQILDQEGV
ncbi:MAG: chemotaxis protein CheC [Agathobacter sp.]|nr:chemotaxis protein CheC [Agathobacter sp.]